MTTERERLYAELDAAVERAKTMPTTADDIALHEGTPRRPGLARAIEAMKPTLVDTLVVKQDVGSYEPHYKLAKLQLWSDGTVTWMEPTEEEEGNHFWQTWVKRQ